MDMLRLVVAALLGCLACDAQTITAGNNDIVPAATTRIIGGTETQISRYPYLISLEKYGNIFTGWQHDCGGSIVAPTVILTAAHCVVGSDRTTSNLRIRAGSTTRGSGGQVRRLRQITIHPRYNSVTDDYDVGVLLLTSALAFNSEVRAVPIQRAGVSARVGEQVSIAGWGVTNTQASSIPTRLMHTSVSIVSRESCSARYQYIQNAQITTRMICALTPNRDSCQGDSGGPMVNANGLQVGIVSFGYGCAEPTYPGVYTDVANSEVNSFIRSFLSTSTVTTTTQRPTASRPTTSRPNTSRPTRPGRPAQQTSTQRPNTSRPTLPNLGTTKPGAYRGPCGPSAFLKKPNYLCKTKSISSSTSVTSVSSTSTVIVMKNNGIVTNSTVLG